MPLSRPSRSPLDRSPRCTSGSKAGPCVSLGQALPAATPGKASPADVAKAAGVYVAKSELLLLGV